MVFLQPFNRSPSLERLSFSRAIFSGRLLGPSSLIVFLSLFSVVCLHTTAILPAVGTDTPHCFPAGPTHHKPPSFRACDLPSRHFPCRRFKSKALGLWTSPSPKSLPRTFPPCSPEANCRQPQACCVSFGFLPTGSYLVASCLTTSDVGLLRRTPSGALPPGSRDGAALWIRAGHRRGIAVDCRLLIDPSSAHPVVGPFTPHRHSLLAKSPPK
ncbi:hypothetical protein IWX48DRAFT_403787 [Phyllosticta citricarpa]